MEELGVGVALGASGHRLVFLWTGGGSGRWGRRVRWA